MTTRTRIVDEDAGVKATVLDYANSKPLAVRLTDTNGDYVAGSGGGGGDGAIVDGVSASIKATVLDYVASNPLAVRLTDTNGDYVGAGAGTQYTEDAAAAANPTGTMVMAVRADTLAAVTSADGDNIAARATNKGELYVRHDSTIDVSGNVNVLTVPTPLSTAGGGAESGALRVTIASDSTGLLSVDDNGGSLTVDNGGTFAVQESGAALTALQLIDNIVVVEDAPAAGGESGVQVLAVRKDTGGTLASADGDFTPFQTDSSGNLRVNVAAGGAGDGAILDGVTSSIKATVLDYTNSNPLAVRLTDTAGDYVGAGAGTQYTEDAASAADPVGTQIISRRRDTLSATEVSADGDVIAVNSTNKGELYVKHVDSVPVTDNGSSLTVDNAALSVVGGGVEATALRVTLASDSTGLVSVDDNGGSLTVDGTVTANAGTGTFVIGDGGGSITVDGAVSVTGAVDTELTTDDLDTGAGTDTRAVVGLVGSASGGGQLIPGSATDGLLVNLGANNDVTVTGSVGISAGTNNIGDVDVLTVPAPLSTTGGGTEATALRVTIANDSTGVVSIDDNGGSLTVDGTVSVSGTVTVGSHDVTNAGTFAVQASGNVAHDAADSGNPVKIGAKAETSPKGITLVADGDRTDLLADADGMLMVKVGTSNADLISERIADTSGTSTAFTNFSAVASTRNYVTSIHIYNSSATAGFVDFLDGAAGAVLFTAAAPAGGGMTIASPVPLFKTTANTALAYDVSGALTTVYINVAGYQSKA